MQHDPNLNAEQVRLPDGSMAWLTAMDQFLALDAVRDERGVWVIPFLEDDE